MTTKPPRRKKRTGRPPGRRNNTPEDLERMRLKIALVAGGLFRDEGFEAVSMRRIAREVGLSAMALYKYFVSKNDILHSIWGGFFDACFNAVEESVHSCKGGPREKLLAACVSYVRYWTEHPDEYRVVFMIEDRVQPSESYFVDSSPMIGRFGLFADIVCAMRGIALRERPQIAATVNALFCALHGACHMLVTVSEFPWPALETLCSNFVHMCDR
jgi:AcrR family transcriptional regulator